MTNSTSLRIWLLGSVALGISSLTLSCSSPAPRSEIGDPQREPAAQSRSDLRQCGAFRGNGDKMFSTFASLAAFTEYYGRLDAVAGASSGGIVSFVYESMTLNPAMNRCGRSSCDDEAYRLRLSLALKSIEGYAQFMKGTPEIKAVITLNRIASEVKKQGLSELLEKGQVDDVRRSLIAILSSKKVKKLINPEVFEMLSISHIGRLRSNIQRLLDASLNASKLTTGSGEVFLRTGIVDMNELTRHFGAIADFYAGYGPSDERAWNHFLGQCAPGSLGRTWSAIRGKSIRGISDERTTCGALYDSILGAFERNAEKSGRAFHHRVDDPVGGSMPSFNSVAVFEGEGVVGDFRKAREDYLRFEPAQFKPGLASFKIGYWGNPSDLKIIARNRNGYRDRKTALFTSLGQVSWQKALFYSSSEPGFNTVQIYDNQHLTAGGWMDPHATLILKNLGCERVVYFSRRGEESDFTIGLARLVGATASEAEDLFSLKKGALQKNSAIALSIAEASAVWCTDWNNHSFPDITGLIQDGYSAPMQVNDAAFLDVRTPYPRAKKKTGLVGCEIKTAP